MARVLLVEDDPFVLKFALGQLVSFGHEVTAVAAGPDALAILREERAFDLLFTDIVLPRGMSGVELARQARVMRPELKVLLTSGYSEDVFKSHGRPDDGTILLRKPYRRKELAEAIRLTLEG